MPDRDLAPTGAAAPSAPTRADAPPGDRGTATAVLRRRVQDVLDTFLDEQAEVLAELGPEVDPLVGSVRRLVAGGKRLRPAFCYWAWRGAGGADDEGVVRAATALELFQAAALIHDDLMDASDTRRGMPAVHRQFRELHREQGWGGDGERFGLAGAVLSGDLCLSWSDELLSSCGLPGAAVERGRQVFDRMRSQLMAGQYLDVLSQVEGGGDDAVARALRVVRFKSAKYTVEHPMLLGGALAHAPDRLMERYSAIGVPLGEAFQLRDDVLGVFGDPGQTGKPAGDDLREGKRTVLVALALRGAGASDGRRLESLLGDPSLTDVQLRALRDVIVGSGALEEVEAMIEARTREARRALAEAPVTELARGALEELVDAATARVS